MAWRSRYRRVSFAILAVALAITLGACTRPATREAEASAGGTIRVAVGIDSSFATFFLADQEGMFREAGLNIELVQFGSGGEAVDALASGQVQLAGSSDTTTISQLRQNPDMRAIFAYEASGDYIKVVLRNGIQTAADIEKIGFVPGLGQVSTDKYLRANGIAADSVEMIAATPSDMPALLARGDIDGYVLWEPWPTAAVTQGIGRVVGVTGDFDWIYHHWAVSTDSWLAKNPAEAQRFAQVLAAAGERVEQDPARAAAATRTAVNVDDEQTLVAIREIDFRVTNLTDEDVDSAQQIVDFYQDIGVLSEQPDLRSAMLLDWYKEEKK
ncbi:ABC transporter substrate-binding protein [Nocardia flavorosea]|uniref:ABC transporter substrate-binding protein n=1 Tax=Nocardia flavorosea TaxID=53429 RepID=A0A846YKX0_9NOCA|nr:ABC transporter substrate-binding protein [Nocardia flavorosea]